MASEPVTELPLVVIVGPTACGKTALAIELAKQCGGEIICADSRTVYTGMDIGTAKPTSEERARVPHFGLDLVKPGVRFTVADFKQYADRHIAAIRARGHVPFLVGGTGLYVDAVLFDYEFGPDVDPEQRQALEQMTLDQLHKYCHKNNIKLPENERNKRHVIRTIERTGSNHKRKALISPGTIVVGITTDKDVLRTRIIQRTEQIFNNGVVEEATMLGKKYGWNSEAMTASIYRLIGSYLRNEISREELYQRNITADLQLAKRQITWFRRNPFIKWLTRDDARAYLADALVEHMKA